MNIATIFLAIACFLCPQISFAEPAPLHVGVLVPLTGSAADQGQWIQQGAELALEEVSGDREVILHVEDSKADPKTAISAYKRLRSQYGIEAVITYGSGVGVTLSPIVNSDKVIQIGVATATPAYRSANDFTFRNFPSAELEAAFLATAVMTLAPGGSVAILRIDNDYGLGTATAIRLELAKLGVSPIFEEALTPSEHDYRATLLRLKHKSPTVVLLAVYPSEGALLLKQAREMGITAPMVASTAIIGAKDFLGLAGGAAEGLYVATPRAAYLDNPNPYGRKFTSSHVRKFSEVPTIQHLYAARAYDALLVLTEAAKSCAPNQGECFRENLAATTDFDGASNRISFDTYGDILTEFVLLRIINSQFKSQLGTRPTKEDRD